MELLSLWFRVRTFPLRFRDLILNQVLRTLCSLGHHLCPRLHAEFAIQPHPGGPCRVTKDGRSFSNGLVPAEKASGVAFKTIGVTLACA